MVRYYLELMIDPSMDTLNLPPYCGRIHDPGGSSPLRSIGSTVLPFQKRGVSFITNRHFPEDLST